MYDPISQSPHTAHTLNPVLFTAVGVEGLVEVQRGALSDIGPTVLDIFNIDIPNEMTGASLLKFN